MEKYNHLKLPLFKGDFKRQKRGGGGGFSLPPERNKSQFSQQAIQKAENLSATFLASKKQLSSRIDSNLIFEIEINQSVSPDMFENILGSMGIQVLSVAEGKKGFWVVFSEDEDLHRFRQKLTTYGSEEGPKYDFFHAIESFNDIPVKKKIGARLAEKPLTDTADFIDLELWKITDPKKNEQFIKQLKESYTDFSQFRLTDTLITKTFVLLRAALTGCLFQRQAALL